MMERWFRGWFELELKGISDAYALDLAAREGAVLEQVRWTGPDVIRLRTDWPGLRVLRRVYRGQRVAMRICGAGGWPLWQRFVRRRPFWVAGLAMFIVGLYGLSSLIWTVDVVGTRDLEPQFVLEKAKEVGLYPGAWRPATHEMDRLQGRLLQMLPGVGWVGLHMTGTRITIEVMEQIKPKEREGKPAGPQQVVAAKRGVVESVLARRGVIQVHRGQTVAPGTLLISGQMPDGTLVAAEGAVHAHVWYTSEITVPLRGKQLGLTGEKQTRQYLTFGSWAIPIWGMAHIPYASYEEREVNVPLTVAGRTWPVGWRQVEFWEATGREWEIARDDAVRRGLDAVKADLLSRAKPGSRVEEQKVLHQEWKNGNLYMTVWTDVLEDIGVARPITNSEPAVPSPGVSELGSEIGG